MIVVAETSPKMVRQFEVHGFYRGETASFHGKKEYSAGPGVLAAKLIHEIGEDVVPVIPTGREVGDEILQDLKDRGMQVLSSRIKDENQEEILILEKNRKTRFLSKEPKWTRDGISEYFLQVSTRLGEGDILLLPAQENADLPEDLFFGLIRRAHDLHVPSVVTANPEQLKKTAQAKPYFLIGDKEDLMKAFDEEVKTAGDVRRLGKRLLEEGAEYVFLIGENDMALLLTPGYSATIHGKEGALKNIAKNRIATGIAIGMERKHPLETTLKLALALGAVVEEGDVDHYDPGVIKGKMNELEVREDHE